MAGPALRLLPAAVLGFLGLLPLGPLAGSLLANDSLVFLVAAEAERGVEGPALALALVLEGGGGHGRLGRLGQLDHLERLARRALAPLGSVAGVVCVGRGVAGGW